MSHSNLVSIIIPVYNVEKFMKECVESVMSQTYKDLEIILVDDGATDSSGRICDELSKKDKRIKVVHKKNNGLNMARKSGFDASTGDWITFVDSDDVIDSCYVEYLLEGVRKHNTDMAVCGYKYFVDEYERDDKKISTYSKPLESTIKMYLLDGRPDEHFFMQTAWGKLFNRRLISLIDWNFSNYKVNEDEFMSIMYYSSLRTPLAVVDNRLLYYRQRPDSIMGQNEKEYVNYFEGKTLTKFEYLAEVYDKRLDRFGDKYRHEIAYWFGLHYITNLSKAYSRTQDSLTPNDKKVFNDRLASIIEARKKHRYWNEHKVIMDEIERAGGIRGFFEYKKSSPSVSVIVPVYNAEKFLDQSLSSIVNQTYFNLDIVLVNDGSTDKSAEICDLYVRRDYRIRLINQENMGVSSARNVGLSVANGKYVMFVDSDDFMELDAVYNLMRAAKKDSYGSDIYIGGVHDYHSLGYSFDYQPNDMPLDEPFSYNTESAKMVYQIMTSINSPFAKIFSREFIENKKLRFDENIRIGEDALFVFQAALKAKQLYRIDSPLYYYRHDFNNDYSATGTMNADKALDFTKAFAQMLKFVKEEKYDEDKHFMQQFRQGLLAHVLYNLSLAERDAAVHKIVFDAVHGNVIHRFNLDASLSSNETEQVQVELIMAGDYMGYMLNKLNEYKRQMHNLIDEKNLPQGHSRSSSSLRKIVYKLASHMSDGQKRYIKRVVRRVRRILPRS